ncbi:DUF3592 domain-containing protein [Streptomyces rochei]|uniref:Rv1733c family protein n=1 Tax=Streptomyces TaxID=1883 RepID=UPI000FA3F59A|nr:MULTISPECIES: DUF3592 domain-containing protein [unclassified Streptomyces]QCB20551.1 hypothetical protein E5N77_00680 [Streptomyces sp. SS52]RSS24333.1 hypothetical protein EF916_27935 [Streptomyces sp. WAC08452]
MGVHGSARKWLWRWRSNPLRRHDDIIEAWLVLVMWAVIVGGGAVAGLVTAQTAQDGFARERAELNPVQAVVLTNAVRSPASDESSAYRTSATVRWPLSDGTYRTGRTLVSSQVQPGAHVTVWVDARDKLASPPAGPVDALVSSVLLGLGSASVLAGAAFGTASLARRRLDRRRTAQWDAEWRLVGPRWSQRAG